MIATFLHLQRILQSAPTIASLKRRFGKSKLRGAEEFLIVQALRDPERIGALTLTGCLLTRQHLRQSTSGLCLSNSAVILAACRVGQILGLRSCGWKISFAHGHPGSRQGKPAEQ